MNSLANFLARLFKGTLMTSKGHMKVLELKRYGSYGLSGEVNKTLIECLEVFFLDINGERYTLSGIYSDPEFA